MRDTVSLFRDRQTAGEFLFFHGTFPLGSVVIGLTPGAVEVGYPTAFLTGGELRHVPAVRWTRGASYGADLEGRCVVLADDALTPLPHVLAACAAIEACHPDRFVFAAPWVPVGFEQNVGPNSRMEVVTLRRGAPVAGVALYDETDVPSGERVAWCLQAVAGAGFDAIVADLVADRHAAAGR